MKRPNYPSFPTNSLVVDLNSKGFYVLCQKLKVELNSIYNVTYNLFNDPIIAKFTLQAAINKKILKSKSYSSSGTIYF